VNSLPPHGNNRTQTFDSGFYKNGTDCISISSSQMRNEIDVTTGASSIHVERTTPAPTPASTTTDSGAAAAESGYYIRGVYIAAKSITSGNATDQAAGDMETTTARVSRYKPWQMRSWGGGGATDAKQTQKPQSTGKEGAVKPSGSHWGLIRGR